jgi:tetratricopeptide (TPR) repeat protein
MRRLLITGIAMAFCVFAVAEEGFAQQAPDAPAPSQNADKPGAAKKPPAPADQAAPKKHSTADDNPFPEDISKHAAEDPANSAPANATGDASHGSDSSVPSSSSQDKLQGIDLLGDTTTKSEQEIQSHVLDTKQATEDERIGELYLKNENPQGAYARFKEATLLNPGDPRAVFDLAEAARKLNRNDEALENYKAYLDALPDGPKAKASRKALNELASAAKR